MIIRMVPNSIMVFIMMMEVGVCWVQPAVSGCQTCVASSSSDLVEVAMYASAGEKEEEEEEMMGRYLISGEMIFCAGDGQSRTHHSEKNRAAVHPCQECCQ